MIGTVLALGGGGFSMSDDGTSAIDDFLLELTGKDRPSVCFVPTASGDADGYSQRFEAAFSGRAETSVLSLFCHQPWGYAEPKMLLEQDVIYVGGGSTANLLAVWRLHGLPEILTEAAANGVILAGISAGMNCWFDGSSTDSFGPLAPLTDGLGFVRASACPHYLGEPGRRETFQGWVADGSLGVGMPPTTTRPCCSVTVSSWRQLRSGQAGLCSASSPPVPGRRVRSRSRCASWAERVSSRGTRSARRAGTGTFRWPGG
ncbi:peptidase E [Oerskovia sp. M15]